VCTFHTSSYLEKKPCSEQDDFWLMHDPHNFCFRSNLMTVSPCSSFLFSFSSHSICRADFGTMVRATDKPGVCFAWGFSSFLTSPLFLYNFNSHCEKQSVINTFLYSDFKWIHLVSTVGFPQLVERYVLSNNSFFRLFLVVDIILFIIWYQHKRYAVNNTLL